MGDQYISVTDRHNGSQIHLGSGLYSIVTVYNCHREVFMLFPCCLQLIISMLWWVVCGWHFRVLTFAAWVSANRCCCRCLESLQVPFNDLDSTWPA